jgi:hypothetical protein
MKRYNAIFIAASVLLLCTLQASGGIKAEIGTNHTEFGIQAIKLMYPNGYPISISAVVLGDGWSFSNFTEIDLYCDGEKVDSSTGDLHDSYSFKYKNFNGAGCHTFSIKAKGDYTYTDADGNVTEYNNEPLEAGPNLDFYIIKVEWGACPEDMIIGQPYDVDVKIIGGKPNENYEVGLTEDSGTADDIFAWDTKRKEGSGAVSFEVSPSTAGDTKLYCYVKSEAGWTEAPATEDKFREIHGGKITATAKLILRPEESANITATIEPEDNEIGYELVDELADATVSDEGEFTAGESYCTVRVRVYDVDHPGIFDELVFIITDLKIFTKPKLGQHWTEDGSTIAAGKLQSDVHKADVKIICLDDKNSIDITLVGGGGTNDKKCSLVIGGKIIEPGQTKNIPVNNLNEISGTLISSNTIEDVSIDVTTPDIQNLSASTSVSFAWDNLEDSASWTLAPREMEEGESKTFSAKFALDGNALGDHEIDFYVEEVEYEDENGQTQTLYNTPGNESDLSEWATVTETATTDASGACELTVKIQQKDGIKSIVVRAYDTSVYKSN